MGRILCGAVAIFVVSIAVADDGESLQGKWRLIASEHKGKVLKNTDPDFREHIITVTGKEMTVTLALLAAPDIARDEVVIKGRSPFSGATVANLSPALADELQIQNAEQGVVVLDVENGSYASNLGFRRGDVVLAVNGRTIDKTGELARVTEQPSRTWRVTIRRGAQQISAVFGG